MNEIEQLKIKVDTLQGQVSALFKMLEQQRIVIEQTVNVISTISNRIASVPPQGSYHGE